MKTVRIHTKQLVPKCVITEDIFANGTHPIIPRKTVVEPVHIEILNRFLINEVNVAENLANGLTFFPDDWDEDENEEPKKRNIVKKDFFTHYKEVVEEYAAFYSKWQNGVPFDMNEVRQLMLPLFERVDHHQKEILLLADQSNKESYVFHHSVAMSLLAAMFSKNLGFEKDWIQVSLAALLSDSGMSKITTRIITKKTALVQPEREEMKKHPTYSYRLIEKCASLTRAAKLGVIQHHEKLDGSGYPLGVRGDKIHRYAKIISIVDAYHAMTAERFYQERKPFFAVLPEMIQERNRQFDPELLEAFIKLAETCLIHQIVYLSNGERARIVSLTFDEHPELLVQTNQNKRVLSIADQSSLTIERFL